MQIVPPFPFKISRKQTKEFAQTVFIWVGGFLGESPSLQRRGHPERGHPERSPKISFCWKKGKDPHPRDEIQHLDFTKDPPPAALLQDPPPLLGNPLLGFSVTPFCGEGPGGGWVRVEFGKCARPLPFSVLSKDEIGP